MNRMHDSAPPRITDEAVLDSAHIGDIKGALGTIRRGDVARRIGWRARLTTLLAIAGPGLIVMVGDNDAGAFSTYAQAGQNYGTSLLWTLALLIPVLYVNQEMVMRLGSVTGVGHARLILERFGKFWGAFSVIDLFILNALTIVTEFIGIGLGLDYLGVPKLVGIAAAAVVVTAIVSTGSFRVFERFALALVLGSLLLVPFILMVDPPLGPIVRDTLIPNFPQGAKLSEVMLLIIAIVGTTVAPWQLFFQQSYVIDKRITPRFASYQRADLFIGIVIVIVGAMAIMAGANTVFAGHPEFTNFVDTGAVARGIGKYAGRAPAVMFTIALIDACLIGAVAVSLSTAYAIGDVLSLKHSLHRKPTDAIGFYVIYVVLIVVAAALVLIPGAPLGLLTNAVQTLAGILLPSASVFLLLLCNDKAVLGPWVNGKKFNIFTSLTVGVLVILSVILTGSVIFPDISEKAILSILGGGVVIGLIAGAAMMLIGRKRQFEAEAPASVALRDSWRMPPLNQLKPASLSIRYRFWMGTLRVYLIVATIMAFYKFIQVAF